MLKKDETIEVKYRVKDTHHRRIGVRPKQHAQPSSTAASLPSAMKVTTNPTAPKSKKSTKTVQIAVNDVPYILPTKVKQVSRLTYSIISYAYSHYPRTCHRDKE